MKRFRVPPEWNRTLFTFVFIAWTLLVPAPLSQAEDPPPRKDPVSAYIEQHIPSQKESSPHPDPLYTPKTNQLYANRVRGEAEMPAGEIFNLYIDNAFMKKWNNFNKSFVDAMGYQFRSAFKQSFSRYIESSGQFPPGQHFDFYTDAKVVRSAIGYHSPGQKEALVSALRRSVQEAIQTVEASVQEILFALPSDQKGRMQEIFEQSPVSQAYRTAWGLSPDETELLARLHGHNPALVEDRVAHPDKFQAELEVRRSNIRSLHQALIRKLGADHKIFETLPNPLGRTGPRQSSLSPKIFEIYRKYENLEAIQEQLGRIFGVTEKEELRLIENLVNGSKALSLSPLFTDRDQLVVEEDAVRGGFVSADAKGAGALDLANSCAAALEEGPLVENLRARERMVTWEIEKSRRKFVEAVEQFVSEHNAIVPSARRLRFTVRNVGDDFVVVFRDQEGRVISLDPSQRVNLQSSLSRKMGETPFGVRIAYTETGRGETPDGITQDISFAGQLEQMEKALSWQLTGEIPPEILGKLTIGVGIVRVLDPSGAPKNTRRSGEPRRRIGEVPARTVTRFNLVLTSTADIPGPLLQMVYAEFESLLDSEREAIKERMGFDIPSTRGSRPLFEFTLADPNVSGHITESQCIIRGSKIQLKNAG